jgi:hypothetical protein
MVYGGAHLESQIAGLEGWASADQASGRFFVKKLRKKLLLPGDVATARVKVSKVFCGAFLQKSDPFL